MNKNKKPKMTKNDLKTAKRLMKYVTEKYKFQFILVFFCILISAVATTAVSLSLRYLLDDFILPLVGQKTPDFAGLYKALTVLGCNLSGRCHCNIYLHKNDGLYWTGCTQKST